MVHNIVELGRPKAKKSVAELMRASRFHNGRGQWGDQMIPIVKMAEPIREGMGGTEP